MKHRIILLVLAALLVFSSCGVTEPTETKTYNWNNGRCEECNGELIWDSSGSKEHYICKRCGKEYTFDGVYSKK